MLRPFPDLRRGESMLSWSARLREAFEPLLNLTGDRTSTRVRLIGRALVVEATALSGAKPFSLLRVDAADRVVVVRGGQVTIGATVISVPDTEVTVAGGTTEAPTWGAVECDISSGSARVLPATTVDRPSHSLGDGAIARRPLFRAYLVQDRPKVLDWRWDGDWDLTGWFAS